LILGSYLYWYLKSSFFQKYCRSSITGTGTPGFSQDSIRKNKIPLPGLDEQKWISEILFKYEKSIKDKTEIFHVLKEIKKGLVQKLLTGQIRVKV